MLANNTVLGMQIQRRWEGIDVLRGLSVLLVVLHHIHIRFRLNRIDVGDLVSPAVEKVLFWSGYYAVIVFFVISGFLITSLSLRRWGSLPQIELKRFYWLRVARIAPCLLLLLAVLSVLHLAGVTGFTINPERATLGRALLAALTFHVNWLEGQHGYLPGAWDILWSLSVEETFYLLFPLACVCLRNERMMLLPIVALIVIGPFNRVALAGQDPWDSYAYLSCMDGIAFGCLAAWIAVRVRLSRSLLRVALALGMVASLLVIVFRGQTTDLGLVVTGLNITVLELGVALILLALANGVGNALLTNGTSLLQWIGRSSYEIYLVHMFAVLGLMQLFKAMAPSVTSIPWWYTAMLLASILFGYALSRWFSEPMNRVLRNRWPHHPQRQTKRSAKLL